MAANSFNRVLFVGTGGGNDVFSTVLAALSLWNIGWRWNECSFAGVLSPFHTHTVGESTHPGCSIVTASSKRFVVRKDWTKQIGFVDAAVAGMIKTHPLLKAKRVYGLSLAQGVVGLTTTLESLATEYEYIVLVDVGGDCFYSGHTDPHVLSPMFDAIVIKAFVESGVPGELFEAGPGTDGELEPEALEKALQKVRAEAHPMQATVISEWKNLYDRSIAKVRQGRTVPMTLQAFASNEKILKVPYAARSHLGDLRLYAEFEQRISVALCKQFFLLDPRKIRNPFAVYCNSPIDWFLKTQVKMLHTNCEANLEYLHVGQKLMQFLTPSPLLDDRDRKTLIKQGIIQLDAGSCDAVWLLPHDHSLIPKKVKKDRTIFWDDGLLRIEPR